MSNEEFIRISSLELHGDQISKERTRYLEVSRPRNYYQEVAPGKNRLIYLWGHLTAVHDAMLPLLVWGNGSIQNRCSLHFKPR
jgi:hypothetical protein